ncbi:unnamed protein product, partial [Ectocarpus fasciculatus]
MRRAATGVANSLRVVSASGSRATPAVFIGRHGWGYGPSSAMRPSVHTGSGWKNSPTAAAAAVPAATPSHGRRLSSKSSSGKPTEAADEAGSKPEKSLEVESTPVNTLVSSEGSSPSMLTGPRVKSKKGYLEREGMIRETQKAIREYYKEGMYQDALEVAERLVDQVDDHFGRAHGVYGSALSDMALMLKSMGRHQEATETYLKALEV